MKKLVGMLFLTIIICLVAASAFAVDQTKTSTVSATVGNIFSLAFYNDANVVYNTSIPFSVVDPSSQYNYADGRAELDGKSDIGLVVITNFDLSWFLKIQPTDTTGNLSGAGKIGIYMSQPINRNTGGLASGALGQGEAWFTLPVSSHTLYSSAGADNNNTPFGTLATLNFKVDGTGLAPGAYATSVTYTLTTTP